MVHGVRELTVALGCAVATVVLGLVPPSPAGQTELAGLPPWLLHTLVLPTEPYVLLPAIALLLLRHRTLFVVLAPAVAVAANTWLLKPAFDLWKNDTLVYPSGHTVSLVAVLVVTMVLTRRRMVVAVVGVLLLACATVGMIGLGYHYLTDIAGGVFFATFTVLTLSRVRSYATRKD